MSRPLMILDQHFRKKDELFSAAAFAALSELCEIAGGEDHPMDPARVETLLQDAAFYVAASPELGIGALAMARNLKAVIEVSGAFREGIDYQGCFDRGIDVLSCMPGFRQSVAEMTLAMILSAGRGLVDQHEAFRRGDEEWIEDRPKSDFTLFGQTVGFVGFGEIARETCKVMAPFSPQVMAYDPWLPNDQAGVPLVGLDEVMSQNRVVVIAASPSNENAHFVGARDFAMMQDGAVVVLISRAHCVDFPAMVAEAATGRITVAVDVFPDEPVPMDDPVRKMRNVILSPHRAAAVPGGRQLIGDMIVHDVRAILDGRAERMLKPADPARIKALIGAQKEIHIAT
jgi:phosphoglycerate dehydrogenase-like enzyme